MNIKKNDKTMPMLNVNVTYLLDEKNSFGILVLNEKKKVATVSVNLLKIYVLKNYGHCKYEIFQLLKEMKKKKKRKSDTKKDVTAGEVRGIQNNVR